MNQQSLMQQALNDQWEQLPNSLRAHYQSNNNIDIGELNIDYPRFMQPVLNLLQLMGVLINRRGKKMPTTVEKTMQRNIQYWKRTIQFPDGKTILFKSHWLYAKGNKLIEFINPLIGLKMAVTVDNQTLYYEGESFILKLGQLLLPIPEWLLLGHTTIQETAVDDDHFAMDFRLQHPLFGQVYRYCGIFSTNSNHK